MRSFCLVRRLVGDRRNGIQVRRLCTPAASEIKPPAQINAADPLGDGRPLELIWAGAMFNASTNWVLRAAVENFCNILEGKKNINRLTVFYLRRSGQRRSLGGEIRKYPVLTEKESRVGKRPIPIPQGVAVTVDGQHVAVKGPLGNLSLDLLSDVKATLHDDSTVTVKRAKETKRAPQMHGLFRTLVDNMVLGVSQGFEKKLQMIGVGYRAALEGNVLIMNLGFSHPVRMEIPDGIKVKIDENTKLTVSGINKCDIGNFSAAIRRHRPPEPYNGKGIRYADEVVRKKAVKGGKKK